MKGLNLISRCKDCIFIERDWNPRGTGRVMKCGERKKKLGGKEEAHSNGGVRGGRDLGSYAAHLPTGTSEGRGYNYEPVNWNSWNLSRKQHF